MTIDRRRALAGLLSVGATTMAARQGYARDAPRLATRSRETQALFSDAAKAGLERPRAAGAASPLDLAELVEDALSAPSTDEVSVVANRAGLLLSEVTRDERDGSAVEEPAPASPRKLTPEVAKEYRDLFASAKVSEAHKPELTRVARFVTADRAKGRYKEVQADTNVPWFVVAALHYREANLNFLGHLHNGDPLMLQTIHVPSNRPPAPWPTPGLSSFELWRASARDALRRFPSSTTWDLPSTCFFMESYNGFGCRDAHINTPYLWSYTQHYTRGGFPSDHHFSASYVSRQAGLMTVLVAIQNLSPGDITFAT